MSTKPQALEACGSIFSSTYEEGGEGGDGRVEASFESFDRAMTRQDEAYGTKVYKASS